MGKDSTLMYSAGIETNSSSFSFSADIFSRCYGMASFNTTLLLEVGKCLSGQSFTFDGIWLFGEVFSSWMNLSFHYTGQMADSGFVDVNAVD